jgi:hypothetical protein
MWRLRIEMDETSRRLSENRIGHGEVVSEHVTTRSQAHEALEKILDAMDVER